MSRVFRARNRAPRSVQVARSLEGGQEALLDPAALIRKVEQEAEKILSGARAEASSIVESATLESSAIRDRAQETGWKDGFAAGYDAGLKEAEGMLEEARAALCSARETFGAMLNDSEPKLLTLALDTARRIASSSVRGEPGVLLDLVRRGMEALRDEREFSIRVDPSLLELVEGARDDLGREYAARSIEVIADDSVRDGAVIGTPHGFVDVTVETQIQNIAVALREARKRAGGDLQ